MWKFPVSPKRFLKNAKKYGTIFMMVFTTIKTIY